MKIAIPTMAGKLCAHFGHCETFAIIDVNDDSKTIENTTFVVPPPHEPGLLPKWLGEKNTNMIIAGGMGQRAQQLFQQNNISVVVGAPAEEPEVLVMAYLSGNLVSGVNACDH